MYASIARWQSSGLSQAAWCEQEDLSRDAFRYWLGKYKREKGLVAGCSPGVNPVGGFVPIELSDSSPMGEQLCIRYPNGVSLICPSGIDRSALKGLLVILD